MFVFFDQKEGDPKIVQVPGYSGDYPQGFAIILELAGTISAMGVGLKTKFNYSGIYYLHWESFAHAIFWD